MKYLEALWEPLTALANEWKVDRYLSKKCWSAGTDHWVPSHWVFLMGKCWTAGGLARATPHQWAGRPQQHPDHSQHCQAGKQKFVQNQFPPFKQIQITKRKVGLVMSTHSPRRVAGDQWILSGTKLEGHQILKTNMWPIYLKYSL